MLRHSALAVSVAVSTWTALSVSRPILNESPRQSVGLYAWGCNVGNTISREDEVMVRVPQRIPYFDGRLLRDVHLGDALAIAVLENGDLVQWGHGSEPKVVLSGHNIIKARVSDGTSVYALSKSGTVYSWTVEAKTVGEVQASHAWWKSLLWPFASEKLALETPKLDFRESISDIAVGKQHILALTTKGRVLSGSTGSSRPSESKGQYGIASMSQFDKAPEPGQLHEIRLLKSTPVAQIAAGDNHSLVRTVSGKLLGFGDNLYGQLGVPYSYRTVNIAVPTELRLRELGLGDASQLKVTDIAAGGAISYFTVLQDDKPVTFAMGNGLTGQLGTGSFSHAQRKPVHIKALSELSEYSEVLAKTRPLSVATWSVGPTHTSATLDNDSEHGRDVLVWGYNEFSQLGNGKRSISGAPKSLTKVLEDAPTAASTINQQLVQGAQMRFVDPRGSLRKAKVDSAISCGHNATALYFKPA